MGDVASTALVCCSGQRDAHLIHSVAHEPLCFIESVLFAQQDGKVLVSIAVFAAGKGGPTFFGNAPRADRVRSGWRIALSG